MPYAHEWKDCPGEMVVGIAGLGQTQEGVREKENVLSCVGRRKDSAWRQEMIWLASSGEKSWQKWKQGMPC